MVHWLNKIWHGVRIGCLDEKCREIVDAQKCLNLKVQIARILISKKNFGGDRKAICGND